MSSRCRVAGKTRTCSSPGADAATLPVPGIDAACASPLPAQTWQGRAGSLHASVQIAFKATVCIRRAKSTFTTAAQPCVGRKAGRRGTRIRLSGCALAGVAFRPAFAKRRHSPPKHVRVNNARSVGSQAVASVAPTHSEPRLPNASVLPKSVIVPPSRRRTYTNAPTRRAACGQFPTDHDRECARRHHAPTDGTRESEELADGNAGLLPRHFAVLS